MQRKDLESQENSKLYSDLIPISRKTHQKVKSERIFQLYSTFLSSERLLAHEPSTGFIGPGYYDYNSSSLGGPFCTFSSVKRFTPTYSGVSSPPAKDFSNFTLKNMDLAQYQPQSKKDLLRIKAKQEQTRIAQTQKNKQKITKSRKKDKLKKLQDKQNKFRMKIQHIEVNKCVKAWMSFLAFVTTSTSIQYRKDYLKDLHKRSDKLLRFLIAVCKFIGKSLRMIKINKVNKALAVLNRFACVIKKWINKKRLIYSKVLNQVIYRYAGNQKIFGFLSQWRSTLVFIQRVLKRALVEKKIYMALKLMHWERIEKSLMGSQVSVKGGVKGKFMSITPNYVREKMIKNLLKKRTKEYCANLKRYRETIQGEFVRLKNENMRRPGGKRNNMTLIIRKSQPNYNFGKKDYLMLIKQATLLRKNSKMLTKDRLSLIK